MSLARASRAFVLSAALLGGCASDPRTPFTESDEMSAVAIGAPNIRYWADATASALRGGPGWAIRRGSRRGGRRLASVRKRKPSLRTIEGAICVQSRRMGRSCCVAKTESRFRARAYLERTMRDARDPRGRDLACLNTDALQILTLTRRTCDDLTLGYMRVYFVNGVVVDRNFALLI
jgi:hypothetical protein